MIGSNTGRLRGPAAPERPPPTACPQDRHGRRRAYGHGNQHEPVQARRDGYEQGHADDHLGEQGPEQPGAQGRYLVGPVPGREEEVECGPEYQGRAQNMQITQEPVDQVVGGQGEALRPRSAATAPPAP